MPIDELQLRALRETMVAVNHVVLNRLVVVRVILDELKNGKSLTERQLELMDQAVSEIVEHLSALSELEMYETREMIKGIYAVKYRLAPGQDAASKCPMLGS